MVTGCRDRTVAGRLRMSLLSFCCTRGPGDLCELSIIGAGCFVEGVDGVAALSPRANYMQMNNIYLANEFGNDPDEQATPLH
jgi:hypothetical protein